MSNTKTEQLIAESIALLNKSGFKTIADVANAADLVGETAVVQPLHVGEMLVAYLIGVRESTEAITQEKLVALKTKMGESFSNDDLKSLCFELHIQYEDLDATTLDSRILSLIGYAQRNGRLADLANYCRYSRNHITWPDFPNLQEVAVHPQEELAVIISVNHHVLEPAATFLAAKNIKCNFLLITTSSNFEHAVWLPDNRQWGPAVADFYKAMHKAPQVKRHFFFAAPVPFAFAIGAAWGLVKTGDDLYHWDGGQYVPVMTTTRDWKGS